MALEAITSVEPSSRGHPPTEAARIRWFRGDTCRLRRRRPIYDLLLDWGMNPERARAVCALLLGTIRLDAAYAPDQHGSALLARLQPAPPPTAATVRMWVRTALRVSAPESALTGTALRIDSGLDGSDGAESWPR